MQRGHKPLRFDTRAISMLLFVLGVAGLPNMNSIYAVELSTPIGKVEKPTQHTQPGTHARLITATELIRASQARTQFSVTGAGLTVAVIDTGLRTTHVDFSGRVVTQRNFTTSNGGNSNNANDDHGHGTNVAGIICASGDHTGIAPGAQIIPLKVLDGNGNGTFNYIRDALQWVIDNRATYNITVVNMSLGDAANHTTPPEDNMGGLIQALRNANVAVVAASGNGYYSFNSQAGMGYPAILPATISVGAVFDADVGPFSYGSGAKAHTSGADRITPFSQRLHESQNSTARTDIFAPGAPITSSGNLSDNGESIHHGTSQAAPITAGVVLLMQELYKKQNGVLPSVDTIENVLRDSAKEIKDGDDENDNVNHSGLTFRRVDALGALQMLQDSTHGTGPVSIVSQPQDQSVSEGQTATFSVIAGGAGPIAYQWQKNGANISGANASQYQTDGAVAVDNGSQFRCVVSNGSGRVTSAAARLAVSGGTIVELNNGGTFSASVAKGEWRKYYIRVPNDATALTITTSGSAADLDLYVRKGQLPTTAVWDFRPYLVSGDEQVKVDAQTLPVLSGGIWFCAVYGFEASGFAIVAEHNGTFVNTPPVIDSTASANPAQAIVGEEISFSVSANDPDGQSLAYTWSFGDGIEGQGSSVSHAYGAAGTYTATVIVSDGVSAIAETVVVTVLAPPEPLSIQTLSIKLNFRTPGKDCCSLDAHLALPDGFDPAGVTAKLNIGGVDFNFPVDSRGRSRATNGVFMVKTRGESGIAVRLKNGNWGESWSDRGFANADVRSTNISMPVTLTLTGKEIGEIRYAGAKTLQYTAKPGKSGIGR